MPIFDLVSRRTVGTLDESFVIGWITTGATFIVKGQLWQVVDLDDGKIIVEPAHAAGGELPHGRGGSRFRCRLRLHRRREVSAGPVPLPRMARTLCPGDTQRIFSHRWMPVVPPPFLPTGW
ncbi:hypothetical protein [Methanogenium cariaci]|uniref:hypothetical protein n=1 Tax=Methanogenium cariaci TaxID=2197 RepID=UPI001FDEA426|nr:hypothetical protein [Methanogenium cariaci]